MYGIRKQCFWAMRAMHGKKVKKEQDLFPLDIDKEIRRAKQKTMKPIQKILRNDK